MTATVTARTALADRGFWTHYLQMLVAMVLGMVVLGMLWPHVPGIEATVLVMATNMTVGMSAWMLWRRHPRVSVAQMAAAMYVPFLVLLPPLWAGWLTGDGVMLLGHLLMLPAMVAAMLLRPHEYVGHRPR
ncbi:hypothetical protein [Pseudonocardia abyssalis]|jgi:flagellar biosynthetic protein FliP|uniref:Flagellar biosynthetic protein FliP n=1 Tax=Pseudonocardia abyssalis TaxID=2792008 RepID=A0ABS6UYZ3_9PSEU|nr:hypothetical protein [Pseudonocardia abyssalis]MBW0117564.1 hypothetical protein [Pseudonocardia abyssalis]MBW0137485.1 hypothetical protein [Pseudonocardia abyssalis]